MVVDAIFGLLYVILALTGVHLLLGSFGFILIKLQEKINYKRREKDTLKRVDERLLQADLEKLKKEKGLTDHELVDLSVIVLAKTNPAKSIPMIFKKAVDEHKQDALKVAYFIRENTQNNKVLKLLNKELSKRGLETLGRWENIEPEGI